jgi:hypothetical protein
METSASSTGKYFKRIEIIDEGGDLRKRSKYIPLRLTEEERSLLSILLGGLEISEYTDKVDVSNRMYGSMYFSATAGQGKSSVMKKEIGDMISFITGLYVAQNFAKGQKLSDANDEATNEFFRHIFELGRRYKVLNPDKMRTNYGKLMYMMQDAMSDDVLEANLKIPIKGVLAFLQEKGVAEMLDDKNVSYATRCLVYAKAEERAQEFELRKKARDEIVATYTKDGKITEAEVIRCLDSLADSNSYILSNRHPVDKMIDFLHKFFDRDNEDSEFSLQIRNGKGGSCLSHNHSTQFTFVDQSLNLWREIQHEMFRLWNMADNDLLCDNRYCLVDTGQGYQRMLSCPNVSKVMSQILGTVRRKVEGGWVGLSVVHLGDRDVPNALIFIDKYTQVPRILAPIVQTIERLHEIEAEQDPALSKFIEHFGGLDKLCKTILADFFKHGFDGSGDDGGSCIDGRLTSAWNWCSQIEKKDYYPVFLLTGFFGFDGSFKK